MPKQTCVAYIRVSTVRQGEKGVSLQEQKDAILRYSRQHGLTISQWFEERVTAAKRGRPQFGRMLKLLKRGKADGVIIHKIDRGSRNLKDWADLGELIDQGVTVHCATESIDLSSRGGRLSADIQAVVAADFIRNLREETRKGFYGRLKQGLYPLPAPIGYLDTGSGNPKIPDPEKANLVRHIFELYGTGNYSFADLEVEAKRIGLTTRVRGPITRTRLTVLLNNPFFMGLIRISTTDETFQGIHEPIVPPSLYHRVQAVLRGKTNTRTIAHDFLYRRLFQCANCQYSLIGERQKGHVYYRCHTRGCPTKGVREELIDRAVNRSLREIELHPMEKERALFELDRFLDRWEHTAESATKVQNLGLNEVDRRLDRLTDAFIDGDIEKETYLKKKEALLNQRADVREHLNDIRDDKSVIRDNVKNFLELAERATVTYDIALPQEKREMIGLVTSNRTVDRKNVVVSHLRPFEIIASREKITYGDPLRDVPRTHARMDRDRPDLAVVWARVISELVALVRGQRASFADSCASVSSNSV